MFNDKKNYQQKWFVITEIKLLGVHWKIEFLRGGGVHKKTNIEGELSDKGDLYILQI